MLELPNQEFYKTVINKLKYLMGEIRQHARMTDNVSREMEILINGKKKKKNH